MKEKGKTRARTKAVGIAVAAVVVGIGLLVLSHLVIASAEKAEAASKPATAAAPTTTPASPTDRTPPINRRLAASQSMSGLLLLFSLMSFGLAAVCAGWVVYDIRKSRPAWMTQTKYPVMEKKKKARK